MRSIIKCALVMILMMDFLESSFANERDVNHETSVDKIRGGDNQASIKYLCEQVKQGNNGEQKEALQILGEMNSIESLEALQGLRDYFWTKHAGVIRQLVKRGDIEAHDYLTRQIKNENIKDKQRVWAAMVLMALSNSDSKYQIIEEVLSNDINSQYLRGGLREALFKSVWDENSVFATEIMIRDSKSEHEIRNVEDFIKRSKHIKFTPEDEGMLLEMIAERRSELTEELGEKGSP